MYTITTEMGSSKDPFDDLLLIGIAEKAVVTLRGCAHMQYYKQYRHILYCCRDGTAEETAATVIGRMEMSLFPEYFFYHYTTVSSLYR